MGFLWWCLLRGFGKADRLIRELGYGRLSEMMGWGRHTVDVPVRWRLGGEELAYDVRI